MKMKNLVIPVLLAGVVFLTACPNPKKQDIAYNQFDLPEIDTTQVIDTNSLAAKNVSGYAAKYWGRVMKHCMQSLLINKKDADYLGASNTLGLGTITDEKREITYRVLDENVFSQEELKNIIKPGSSTTCQYEIKSNLDVEALLNSKVKVKNDDDLSVGLSTALKNKKNVTFNIESWQKDELIAGNLTDALKDESNPKKKAFKEDLIKEGRIILTRLIRVKGFSADIELNSDLSAQLQAKLQGGTVANLGDTDGKVAVSIVNSKTIRLKSTNDFFVFGKFVKASKL